MTQTQNSDVIIVLRSQYSSTLDPCS